MNDRIKKVLSVLALVFLVSASASWAQDKTEDDSKDPDKKEKKSVVDSEAELGLYYLSDDSFRFGKYSGLIDDGAYILADFRWEKRPA